jgi:hypothetical protein
MVLHFSEQRNRVKRIFYRGISTSALLLCYHPRIIGSCVVVDEPFNKIVIKQINYEFFTDSLTILLSVCNFIDYV